VGDVVTNQVGYLPRVVLPIGIERDDHLGAVAQRVAKSLQQRRGEPVGGTQQCVVERDVAVRQCPARFTKFRQHRIHGGETVLRSQQDTDEHGGHAILSFRP